MKGPANMVHALAKLIHTSANLIRADEGSGEYGAHTS